jgi:hypothetical protein
MSGSPRRGWIASEKVCVSKLLSADSTGQDIHQRPVVLILHLSNDPKFKLDPPTVSNTTSLVLRPLECPQV